ncbi:MAG: LysE/ArgO family amino acid transporter [Microbacteriaceae bacterium]|nr:LysE/ArgO family amino acid transporter [Microbacteriaceae bacterium]
MTPALVSGMFLGLSLIVAIGAQNAFVLRQGLTGKFVFPVALVSALLDAALITLGVAGLGALLESVPFLLGLVRWLGAGYLVWFGITSLRRARSGQSMDVSGSGTGTLAAALISAATFSLLNPHVYLDTVVFLGALAAQFGDNRWWFAVGASIASFVWFFSLAYGAKALSRFVTQPRFWRILDTVIAFFMFALAIGLVFVPIGD